MAEKTETKKPGVKVKLNQAHTHARQPYQKDEVIEVAPHTAKYLEKQKIGERV